MSGQPDEEITLINVFTVPVAESERFLQMWRRRAAIMAAQPGFVEATMYQAVHDDAELRFINVARWASEEAFDDAIASTDLPEAARRLLTEQGITSRPAVYRPTAHLRPGDGPEGP
ncbi:antibiotic biosynthesis monooxygenase family protein [Pseudonocardia acaciae]|uniref:antibiotic biosynthesis monooxygenase family protein n=1 Tax=Pseudonocardia acaciae TaxID=551276 RepID=UPI00048C4D05|nr:antibiotic biosynthesis monooxygenase family protein [Pseudonocardia acaciae]